MGGDDLFVNIRIEKHGSRFWSRIKAIWKTVHDGNEVVKCSGECKATWKFDRSDQFTVKIAYNSLVKCSQEGRHWKDIWKVNVY